MGGRNENSSNVFSRRAPSRMRGEQRGISSLRIITLKIVAFWGRAKHLRF